MIPQLRANALAQGLSDAEEHHADRASFSALASGYRFERLPFKIVFVDHSPTFGGESIHARSEQFKDAIVVLVFEWISA